MADQTIEYGGVQHTFPDSFSQDDISNALSQWEQGQHPNTPPVASAPKSVALPTTFNGRGGESTMDMLKRTVVQPFKEDTGDGSILGDIKHAANPFEWAPTKAIGNLVSEGGQKVKDLIANQTDKMPEGSAVTKLQRNVVQPAANASADFLTNMAQPESIATMGVFKGIPAASTKLMKAAQVGAAAKFAVPAVRGAIDKGVNAVRQFGEGDVAGGVESATGAAFDTGMAAETGKPVVEAGGGLLKKAAAKVAYPMANKMVKTPTGTGEINPVDAFTPQEIKDFAEDSSQGPTVDMTPAEITEHGGLRAVQGVGQKSLFGKGILQEHQSNAQSAVIGRVRNLMGKLSPTTANTLQAARDIHEQTTKAAEAAKAVANEGYANWRQTVPGDVNIDLTDINKKYGNMLDAQKDVFDNIPNEQAGRLKAGMEKASKFGLKQVDDMGDDAGVNPVMDLEAVREMRSHWLDSLRELKQKGRADSREAGLYTDIVKDLDGSIETGLRNHAQRNTMGTAVEQKAAGDQLVQGWRDANAGWKNYVENFHGDDSVLAEILNTPQTDLMRLPGHILEKATGGNPVHIDQLRNHGIKLGSLQREITDRALNTGFRTSQNKLAGFDDDFLQHVFADNPKDLEALYKNARIGRSVGVDFNPSNTAGTMSARGEFEAVPKALASMASGEPKSALMEVLDAAPGWGAAKLSKSRAFKNWMTRTPKSAFGKWLTGKGGGGSTPGTTPTGPVSPSGGGQTGGDDGGAAPTAGGGSRTFTPGSGGGKSAGPSVPEDLVPQQRIEPEDVKNDKSGENKVPVERRASTRLLKDKVQAEKELADRINGVAVTKQTIEKGDQSEEETGKGDTSFDFGANKLKKTSPIENGKVSDTHVAAENGWYDKAKTELGADAPVSKVLQRAQELKTAGAKGASKLSKISNIAEGQLTRDMSKLPAEWEKAGVDPDSMLRPADPKHLAEIEQYKQETGKETVGIDDFNKWKEDKKGAGKLKKMPAKQKTDPVEFAKSDARYGKMDLYVGVADDGRALGITGVRDDLGVVHGREMAHIIKVGEDGSTTKIEATPKDAHTELASDNVLHMKKPKTDDTIKLGAPDSIRKAQLEPEQPLTSKRMEELGLVKAEQPASREFKFSKTHIERELPTDVRPWIAADVDFTKRAGQLTADVDPSDLNAWRQNETDRGIVDKYKKLREEGSEPPSALVFSKDGEGYLADGHHRSIAAGEMGKKVPARIYSVDSPLKKDDVLDDQGVKQEIESNNPETQNPRTARGKRLLKKKTD